MGGLDFGRQLWEEQNNPARLMGPWYICKINQPGRKIQKTCQAAIIFLTARKISSIRHVRLCQALALVTAGRAAAQTDGGREALPAFAALLISPWSERVQPRHGGGGSKPD